MRVKGSNLVSLTGCSYRFKMFDENESDDITEALLG